MAIFRRLALAMLLLATGASAGVLKQAWQQLYSMFKGEECDKACLATTYSRADLLFSKCDGDSDGVLNRDEYATLLAILFQSRDPAVADREYGIMCSGTSCNQEVGIPSNKMRHVFQHKTWRDALNKRISSGDL